MKFIYCFLSLFLVLLVTPDVSYAQKKKSSKSKQTSAAKKKKATKGKKSGGTHKKRVVPSKPVAPIQVAEPIVPTAKPEVEIPTPQLKKLQEVAKQMVEEDTLPQKEVVITSAFKPSLRNAAKINFSAATAILDTTRLPLTYAIPSQSLFFKYEPASLKPLALQVDTLIYWDKKGFVKAGYGNFNAPLVEAAYGWGNGYQSMYYVHGQYVAAKGNLPLQQYSQLNLAANGVFNTKKQMEISTSLFFNRADQYQYGFIAPVSLTKAGAQQLFNNIGFTTSLKNKIPSAYGLSYKPSLAFNHFWDANKAAETTTLLSLPISKSFGQFVSFNIQTDVSLTAYKDSIGSLNNHYLFVQPSLVLTPGKLRVHIGVSPVWSNATFQILPNISFQAPVLKQKIIGMAGIVGAINKNTYQSISTANPFIRQPNQFLNTLTTKVFVGAKGNITDRFTYVGSAAYLFIKNALILYNDTNIFKNHAFVADYETNLQAFQLHGELTYVFQEKLSMMASATYTNFTKHTTFQKAFGMIPLQVTGTMNWLVLSDVHLKADLLFMDGNYYKNTLGEPRKLNAALDANLGFEFAAARKLDIWLQANNILNNTYQRWNQYQVLGFQLKAGVAYHF